MVEHTLPFVGELVFVVNDHLLVVLAVANGVDDVGQQAERRAGIGGAKVGNVEGLVGTDGLGRHLLEDVGGRGIDHVEATLGGGRVCPLSVLANWRVNIVELLLASC